MDTPDKSLRAVAVLATGSLASRILGFVRDIFFAGLLGPAADLFLVAFRIPNFFRKLLADGSLGLAFGASGMALASLHGRQSLNAFSRSVGVRLFLLALVASLCLGLLARPLVLLLAPGLPERETADCVNLVRLCLPYIPFCLLSAIVFSHLAVSGDFRPQAWSSLVWNCVILAVCLFAACLGPLGLHPSTLLLQKMLCAGVVAGGMVQALLSLTSLAKAQKNAGLHAGNTALILDEKEPGPEAAQAGNPGLTAEARIRQEASRFLRQFPAAVLGAASSQIHFLAAMAFASCITAGGISALYLCERLVELPVSLAGGALGFAILPGLAHLAARGDKQELSQMLGEGLRRGAFLSFPATAGLLALAFPLADMLFGHGEYDSRSVALTAQSLCGYAPAIPALCATRPLLAAVNALGNRKTPMAIGLFSLVPLVLFGLAAVFLWGGEEHGKGMAAVGLGLSAAAWTNTWLLSRALRSRGIISLPPGSLCPLAVYAAASLLMWALLRSGLRAVSEPGAICMAILVVGAALLWLFGFKAAGNKDAGALLSLFRKR